MRRCLSNGYSVVCSDLAIATFETMKALYGLAGRQTEGFLNSLFELMGVDSPVPEHSTVSRRKGSLKVTLPVVPNSGTCIWWSIQRVWKFMKMVSGKSDSMASASVAPGANSMWVWMNLLERFSVWW